LGISLNASDMMNDVMGARRIFSRGVQTQGLVKGCRANMSSVYLWNSNTCCRISLCRKESETSNVNLCVRLFAWI